MKIRRVRISDLKLPVNDRGGIEVGKLNAVAKKHQTQAPEIGEMKWALKALKIDYVEEYVFAPDRKFRADLFLPELNLLVEYEGLFAGNKGGSGKSRHTTGEGYTRDCEKYFIANVLGFKVLRLTAMNYKKLPTYLEMLK